MTEEDRRKMEMMIQMLRAEGYTVQEPAAQPQQPAQGGGPSPAMAARFIPQGGGGAGGGGGNAMAAAGPWAALAAVIAANETYQNKQGNRPAEFSDHMKELATGEVLGRDVERYLGNSEIAEQIGNMGNPEGMWKNMKKGLKPWEWW